MKRWSMIMMLSTLMTAPVLTRPAFASGTRGTALSERLQRVGQAISTRVERVRELCQPHLQAQLKRGQEMGRFKRGLKAMYLGASALSAAIYLPTQVHSNPAVATVTVLVFYVANLVESVAPLTSRLGWRDGHLDQPIKSFWLGRPARAVTRVGAYVSLANDTMMDRPKKRSQK
jgi:hypothetical protein